jgi:hypothetical protein
MYHTVHLFKQIDGSTYSLLFEALELCSKNEGKKYYKPDIENSKYEFHLFKDQGIMIYLVHYKYKNKNNTIHYHAIEIRMNPKRLIQENEYIKVTHFSDYPDVEKAFKAIFKEVEKVFNTLEDSWTVYFCFDDIARYKINRIDYCVNVKSPDAYRLMELIRRADLPKGYEIEEKYDPVSKRTKPYSNALRAKNKSVHISFYDKEYQMKQVFKGETDSESAVNIIRFEIQCKKAKVNSMRQKFKIKNCLYEVSNDKISKDILLYYYEKTIGFENYCTLKIAKEVIRISGYKEKKQAIMIEVLKLIAQKRSVWKARKEYELENVFDQALKDIKKMGINPVTVPDGWEIEYLPNLIQEIEQEFMTHNNN